MAGGILGVRLAFPFALGNPNSGGLADSGDNLANPSLPHPGIGSIMGHGPEYSAILQEASRIATMRIGLRWHLEPS